MFAFPSRSFHPAKDLPDLTGKVILVTGANTGVGYATVKNLASRGAKVYLGARDEGKAYVALAKMQEGLNSEKVLFHRVDLCDPRSAKAAAEAFLARESRLDVLVNNAAHLLGPFEISSDGISKIMQVNHFGTVAFTQALLPLLIKTAEEPTSDVRIITLASISHMKFASAMNPDIKFCTIDDFNSEFSDTFYPAMSRYAVTKLTNLVWTKALQKRLSASNVPIICISIDPGSVNTFADRTPFPMLARIVMRLLFVSPEIGSYNSCFAAASPLIRENPEIYKGAYMEPVGQIKQASKVATNEKLADELWDTTERILKELAA